LGDLNLNSLVLQCFDDLKEGLEACGQKEGVLVKAAETISKAIAAGKTVYLCGNGGSASECQHLAAEFVGRFLMERPGLPAWALTTDTSKLTAIGNDYGFEQVFTRQIKAVGRPGDVLWGLSTSGVSPNVIGALREAKSSGLKTIFMCGNTIHEEGLADLIISTPGKTTPRVQELHLLFGHIICQLVDEILFGDRRP
jgi:D-sedoheptulose 7-phosphate isomerase